MDLWAAGLWCGLAGLFRGPARRKALRLCLAPVDLWRYVEFPAVLDAFGDEPFAVDIGSPKLAAALLARRSGHPVAACDILPAVGPEVALYRRALRVPRLRAVVLDARRLPFADDSVPFLFSVSALEHVGNEGDVQAMREAGRVLAPGGTAVVTMPVAPAFREVWADADPYGGQERRADGQVFFSYLYDAGSVAERLVAPSGLTLERATLHGEREPGWYEGTYLRWTSGRGPRALLAKLLDPVWARTRLRHAANRLEPIDRRGVVALTLRKPVRGRQPAQ